MLFSSIVFMSRTLRGQWINVLLVFVIKLNIASSSQMPHDNVAKFSGDFEVFLKDLGSMVYKSKKTVANGNELRSNHDRYTTVPYKSYRRNQNIYNTQKAALGDVLMMKLVSYYEDKYKLTHLEPTTTEGITFVNTFTNSANRYYVEPERGEQIDNRLQNQVNQMHQMHQMSQINQANQMNQVTLARNRRIEGDIFRRFDEDYMPEVVIL